MTASGDELVTLDQVKLVKDHFNKYLVENLDWSSGTIQCPGVENYRLYCITMRGNLTCVLAARYSDAIRGIGGWDNGSSSSIYQVSITVNDDYSLTLNNCTNIVHSPSSNHSQRTNQSIQAIIGLL